MLGLRQFNVIKENVTNRNLIEHVDKVGKTIGNNVQRASDKSSKITGVRTVGTSTWIDTGNYETTMELYHHMRQNGVLVKLNGARGVMTKPALTLNESQAGVLSTTLQKF